MRPILYLMCLALAAPLTGSCVEPPEEPVVVLVELDGAGLDIVDELRAILGLHDHRVRDTFLLVQIAPHLTTRSDTNA